MRENGGSPVTGHKRGPRKQDPVRRRRRAPRTGPRPAQGRPRVCQDRRRTTRVPPPALHPADPREPSDQREGPVGEGTRPHPPGQVRARRRMAGVRDDAGVQGRPVRAHIHARGPVLPLLAAVLRVRVQGRTQALAVREWTCGNCGTVHDRDANAAISIKTEGGKVAAGQAETQNGRGTQVSRVPVPAQRDEAATHPKQPASPARREQAGIPSL